MITHQAHRTPRPLAGPWPAIAAVALAAPTLLAQPVINPSQKLLASDGAPGGRLGFSVALDDGRAVVGSPAAPASPIDPPDATAPGSAYIFDPATGAELFRLAPADGTPGDEFGASVALDSSIVLVGAPLAASPAGPTGAAYLFSAVSGVEFFQLAAPSPTPGDLFGTSAAIEGTHAIVGAPGAANGTTPFTGAVFVFDAPSATFQRQLNATDANPGDGFGTSVAISGSTIVIGAPGDDAAATNAGAAYVFDASTGLQAFKLTHTNAAAGDQLGASVAIAGSTIVIGTPGRDAGATDAGAAFVFDAATGLFVVELVRDTPAPTAAFGSAVATDGTTAAVGSRGADINGINTGAAALFDVATGAQRSELFPGDGEPSDAFGSAVAVTPGFALVGAAFDDDLGSNSGSAYVFRQAARCGPADVADPVGVLDLGDIDAFIAAFLLADPLADLTPPLGIVDLDDIDAFIAAFLAGCG